MKIFSAPLNLTAVCLLVLFNNFFNISFLRAQTGKQQIIEKILSDIYENSETEFDYSELSDRLNEYFDHPININTASEEQLRDLVFLSEVQISAILNYIRKYKGFRTIFELRLIEELDDETIALLINFITILPKPSPKKKADYFLPLKNNYLYVRTERIFNIKNGVNPDTIFLGDPYKYYIRFYHQPDRNLSYGITMEKDAGEQFFKGAQKQGFDFYSAHFFYQPKQKILKTLAFGDYYASFGQGLLFSNHFNFGKSPYIDQIFISKPMLSPYRSSNENVFLRGIATTLQFNQWSVCALYSNKFRDATLNFSDTFENQEDFAISSFYDDGYHRTPAEIDRKKQVNEQLGLLHIGYSHSDLKLGWTNLAGWYNIPVLKSQKPYKYFSFSGKYFYGTSINYSFVHKGILFFGETATNFKGIATLHGIQSFLSNNITYLLIYRNYSPAYNSPYANAFRENTETSNESGIFTGINWSVNRRWGITFYFDQYRFPWLKYQVNRPSSGYEVLLTVHHQINLRTRQLFRIRFKTSEQNRSDYPVPILQTEDYSRYYIRYQLEFQPEPYLRLLTRMEYSMVLQKNTNTATGFLTQQDITFKPYQLPFAFSFRFALFSISDYAARIYSYEADIPGAFASAMYYRNGTRTYILLKYLMNDKISLYLKAGRYFYFSPVALPENISETRNMKNELKFLFSYSF